MQKIINNNEIVNFIFLLKNIYNLYNSIIKIHTFDKYLLTGDCAYGRYSAVTPNQIFNLFKNKI
jgi:hypothetical protein